MSSPNAAFASLLAELKASERFSMEFATFIPLPPPPAAALIITGKPIFSASCSALFKDEIEPLDPGTRGRPAFSAAIFAETLSPIVLICSGDGPIKLIS